MFNVYFSLACAINLGSTVTITGGYFYRKLVTEYSETGFVRALPQLQEARYGHGCSFYVNKDGTKVDIIDLNYQF